MQKEPTRFEHCEFYDDSLIDRQAIDLASGVWSA